MAGGMGSSSSDDFQELSERLVAIKDALNAHHEREVHRLQEKINRLKGQLRRCNSASTRAPTEDGRDSVTTLPPTPKAPPRSPSQPTTPQALPQAFALPGFPVTDDEAGLVSSQNTEDGVLSSQNTAHRSQADSSAAEISPGSGRDGKPRTPQAWRSASRTPVSRGKGPSRSRSPAPSPMINSSASQDYSLWGSRMRSNDASNTSSYAMNEEDVEDLIAFRQENEQKYQRGMRAAMMARCDTYARLAKSEQGDEDGPFWRMRQLVRRLIARPIFDFVVGLVIVAHAVVNGIEASNSMNGEEMMPAIAILDTVFLAFYIAELSLRFFALGHKNAMKSNWLIFDALLVLFGIIDAAVHLIMADSGAAEVLGDLMLVRILRVYRLARTARLMLQFRTLWMLVQGFLHSLLTLVWTLLIITVLCYIFAILGMELMGKDSHELLPGHTELTEYQRVCKEHFGSLSDAMITMFQFLTLDSVGPVYRVIIHERPAYALYFVAFVLLVPIALMNLVTAIMVESSLQQAKEDRDAQRAWEAARRKELVPKLVDLFCQMDTDGSGELDLEELRAAPEHLKDHLKSICKNLGEVEDIFTHLDYDGSGTVSIEEFCEGLLKAGSGQPVELFCLMRQCQDILKNQRRTAKAIENMPEHLMASNLLSTQSTLGSLVEAAAQKHLDPSSSGHTMRVQDP